MEVNFTLCFIRYEQRILMLLRKKAPNKGRWNGVGGKIEAGEEPRVAMLREIQEETGLVVSALAYRGIVTWNNEGGMYVFLAESASDQVLACDEGRLEWKEEQWVLNDAQVVSNISLFLPYMMAKDNPLQEHAFQYSEQEEILSYQKKPLQEQYQLHQYY